MTLPNVNLCLNKMGETGEGCKVDRGIRALTGQRESLTHSIEALAGDLHNQYILSISGEVSKGRAGGLGGDKGDERDGNFVSDLATA